MPNDAMEVRINHLEKSDDLLWTAVDAVREKLGKLNATVAGLGVVNTLILGWIAYKLTKGI